VFEKDHISFRGLGKKHFYLVASFIGIVMLFMASGAAINIDEPVHYDQAKKVLSWYKTRGKDTSCLETPRSNLKFYGQSPDNLSALINRLFAIEKEYQTRHYLGWVFSFLLLWVTGAIAYEISGSSLAGIVALILLFISPSMMGQAYGNLKDIPFALGYAWSLLMILRLVKQMPVPRWKSVLLLGLSIAFTNSVRIGGMVLFLYLALFFAAWMLIAGKASGDVYKNPRWWKQILIKALVVIGIGYFGGLIFWPFGLIHPVKNSWEALSVMEHYTISIQQIFEGTREWSTNLPWYYLPKWLFISIPEIVIAGALLFVLALYDRIKNHQLQALFGYGMVAFGLLFPLVYVIAIDANLYSGWRQMYFVYPPLIVIASAGLVHLWQHLRKPAQTAMAGISLLLILLPVIHMARTYPSEYIYFNTLAGGNKKAWSNYEYDYYWHEMKKAASWLEKELENNNSECKVASNFILSAYFPDKKNTGFEYVHFYDKISADWDYALLGVNYVHPWQLKNDTWKPEKVVQTFYHKGNPTVIILKGQDKDAREGYTAFRDRNFERAVLKLSTALEKDPADLQIATYLAESYLTLNRFEEVRNVLQKAKTKHPFYEPFLLLDAKLEMKKKNHSEGLEKLMNLLDVNSRYSRAIPYLIECYENTGQPEKAEKLRIKYNI